MGNTPKRRTSTKRQTTPKQANPPDPGSGAPSEDEIRRRAYELYQKRGGQPGHEYEDWARAEQELRGEV